MAMRMRDSVRCGMACQVCGKDEWVAFRGWNRCACGQYLWIKREKDEFGGMRFKYGQGNSLPQRYDGWDHVTR